MLSGVAGAVAWQLRIADYPAGLGDQQFSVQLLLYFLICCGRYRSQLNPPRCSRDLNVTVTYDLAAGLTAEQLKSSQAVLASLKTREELRG